jgi:hypothetical protein
MNGHQQAARSTILSDNVEEDEYMFLPKDTLDFNVLKTLQEKYVFRNDWRDIWNFLTKYPSLPSVLVEAHHNLMKYFPNNPQVFLSISIAPEDLSEDQLVASVASGLDVDAEMDALRTFDEEWWLDSLERTDGKLCVTLE